MKNDTLLSCRLFLLDMDGTLYLGDEVFPGAVDFIRTLERTGRRYIYLTNNSSRAGFDYVNRLRSLGFPCEEENVFTAGMATTMLRCGAGMLCGGLGLLLIAGGFALGSLLCGALAGALSRWLLRREGAV